MEKFSEILKEMGLSEKQIAILKLLYLKGGSYASTLASTLKIQRSSCYELLSSLEDLGFISQIYRNDTRYYLPVSFSQIFIKWKSRQDELSRNFQLLKAELDTLFFNPNIEPGKPLAQFFSGVEGIKNILTDTLNVGSKSVKTYASRSLSHFISKNFSDYPIQRARHGVSARVVYCNHPNKQAIKENNQLMKRESRFLTAFSDFGVDGIIYGNKLALICVPENFGIVVESSMLSGTLSNLYEYVWRIAKED